MRKNTVKKILAALLALGIISALTACNNSQTTAQSTAESSKSVSESSTESSKESSAESSSESSVESSKEVSESSAESSKESSTESSSESSAEPSKAVSESSVESSKEDSKAKSNTASSSSTVEEKKYTLDDAIAYGKIIYPACVSKVSDLSYTIGLDIGTYIAILSTDDPETYDFIYEGYRYKIAKKKVELFSEDYVPDFSKPFWFTVSDIL